MIKVSVNTFMLKSLQDEDRLKTLSVFIHLKSLYSNSCIFDATYANISRKSGISVSTLKRHIPYMVKYGWVYKVGNSLTFNRIKLIDNFYVKNILKIKVYKTDTWKGILKKLHLLFVREVYDKFEASKKPSSDDSKRENKRFIISNKNVGKMINRSRSAASRLMAWGNKNKIIWSERNCTEIPNFLSMTQEEKRKLPKVGVLYIVKTPPEHDPFRPWDCFPKYRLISQLPNFVRFI